MENLSYKIIFTILDPNGFDEKSTIIDEIDDHMSDLYDECRTKGMFGIKRISIGSYKIVYECYYNGSYKCEHVKDTVNLDYFGSYYNGIVYNSDMVKYLRTKDIVTSVDFKDTYLSTGFYEYKATYSNRDELLNVVELHGEKIIENNIFGNNIILANGYDILKNIDDSITYMFTVYSNSPIMFAMQRVWAIENNIQPLHFGVIYKPGKLTSYLLGLNKLESLHDRYLYSKN